MIAETGPISVPPGFRFHPTDEELLYYYLKKKVSYEAIDLDVIREVDLNQLEPWDIKERCKIGSGPQSDWYLFSHKDKKYPTGTRTNRATSAGFWKATGRDKAIFHGNNANRIGMRKTLVFYTGRAPHGQKTDWIMHEYRLEDDHSEFQQEDGWVVCRVFKKKSHGRGLLQGELHQEDDYDNSNQNTVSSNHTMRPSYRHHNYIEPLPFPPNYTYTFDGTLNLPQLSSQDTLITLGATNNLQGTMESLLRLTTNGGGGGGGGVGVLNAQQLLAGGLEPGFLDKLLANYQGLDKVVLCEDGGVGTNGLNHNKISFQYLGSQ